MTSLYDFPEILDYYKQKGRDLPKSPAPTPVSKAIQALDTATIKYLYHGGTEGEVDDKFEAVLNTPGNTWTREQLNWRQRQEHYK